MAQRAAKQLDDYFAKVVFACATESHRLLIVRVARDMLFRCSRKRLVFPAKFEVYSESTSDEFIFSSQVPKSVSLGERNLEGSYSG